MAKKDINATDEFIKGLWRDNPVFIQMLGLCPALAVSNTAINALAMGAATTFVLVMAGLSVSLLKSFIPREARIVHRHDLNRVRGVGEQRSATRVALRHADADVPRVG